MDEIIERVGNFGLAQGFLFSATSMSIGVGVMGMVFMVYGSYNPGWWCNVHDGNWTDRAQQALGVDTTPLTINVTYVARATDDCKVWRQCPDVVFDSASSTIVTEWNLMCDMDWIPSIIFTVQMCGVILGACLSGPIGDGFGRKASLYSSIAVHCIANLVCGFTNSWQLFAALRFFIGVGVGGIVASAYLYPLEFVGQWWRPVLNAVPTWSFGAIEFALVVYIFRDWRHVHFATSALSAGAFLPIFWMPESMRWLAINGKVDKCLHVIQRMAQLNRNGPLELDFINRKIGELIQAQKDIVKPNYKDLFKTVTLRKYSLKFGLCWILAALVYYALNFGIKAFDGDFYTNLLLFSLTEIPATIVSGPMANKFGRRWAANILLLCASLSCFLIVLMNFIPGHAASTAAIAVATFAKMTLIAGWNVFTLISIELYPTVVRNLHAGYLNALCRFGSIFAPFIIPADKDTVFIAYLVMGFLVLVCVMLIRSVSESKGRAMTDTVMEPIRKKQPFDLERFEEENDHEKTMLPNNNVPI